MRELIQAEVALGPPMDKTAQAIFSSLKQELEGYLGNMLLRMKHGNKYTDLPQLWKTTRTGTDTELLLQSNIYLFKPLLHLLKEHLARLIDD